MRKRPSTKKQRVPAPPKVIPVIEPLRVNNVKRVAFYLTDPTAPKGRRRKVIALGIHYLDALEHIGVFDKPRWLGQAVDKHYALNGQNDALIRIVEFCIIQALLSKIERVTPVECCQNCLGAYKN